LNHLVYGQWVTILQNKTFKIIFGFHCDVKFDKIQSGQQFFIKLTNAKFCENYVSGSKVAAYVQTDGMVFKRPSTGMCLSKSSSSGFAW
jgi:hypothetical protein